MKRLLYNVIHYGYRLFSVFKIVGYFLEASVGDADATNWSLSVGVGFAETNLFTGTVYLFICYLAFCVNSAVSVLKIEIKEDKMIDSY